MSWATSIATVCLATLVSTGCNAQGQVVDLGMDFLGYYDPADKKISVKMTPGIVNTDQLLSPKLKAARKRLNQKRKVGLRSLRRLADLGEGNAAFQLAKRLEADNRTDLIGDIAHYYGIAAATGRGGAMSGYVKALDALDPETVSPGRLKNLRIILVAYAAEGNSIAADAMIRYHRTGTPFGSFRQELDELVLRQEGQNLAPVALLIANEILQSSPLTSEDRALAQSYLQTASKAKSLRVRVIAENLLPMVDTLGGGGDAEVYQVEASAEVSP